MFLYLNLIFLFVFELKSGKQHIFFIEFDLAEFIRI